ncbi:MAG: hypothetical protein JSS43_08625 [Proteobacteria bacterium]|nr:hypothetical protein [Pseudomonadota bacterium]
MSPDSTLITVPATDDTGLHSGRQPTPVTPGGGSIFIVDFHATGNSARHRQSGWSGQENSFVWSVGLSSSLRLPAPAETSSLIIETDLTISRSRFGVRAALVRVFANSHLLGSAVVTGWTRLHCLLPAALLEPGQPIELRYEHPNYVRADLLEPSRDDRPLAVCFYCVRLFPLSFAIPMRGFAPKPLEGAFIEAAARQYEEQEAPLPSALYRFGAGQDAAACLLQGWRHDEQGDACAHEHVATIGLPAPQVRGGYIAQFDLTPLFVRRLVAWQRITILLHGAVLGQFRIQTATTLAVFLPPELVEQSDTLDFTLILPDGLAMHPFDGTSRPHFLSILLESIRIQPLPARHKTLALLRDDDGAASRPIAVSEQFLDEAVEILPDAIRAATGVGPADILRDFESLGDNCSFGLAQRKADCEVMGLLRFANTPLRSVLYALADEFAAMDDHAAFSLRTIDEEHKELSLFHDRYGIRWHTNVHAGEANEAKVLADQIVRLTYLRRKFYEALRASRKIFVVARAEPRKHPVPLPFAGERTYWEESSDRLRFAEVVPLFLQLNQYGSNTVLYLTRCANGRRPGAVELLAPGIMRGYVDDFVITPHPETKDHAAWLRVAANAWLLDNGPNAPFRKRVQA